MNSKKMFLMLVTMFIILTSGCMQKDNEISTVTLQETKYEQITSESHRESIDTLENNYVAIATSESQESPTLSTQNDNANTTETNAFQPILHEADNTLPSSTNETETSTQTASIETDSTVTTSSETTMLETSFETSNEKTNGNLPVVILERYGLVVEYNDEIYGIKDSVELIKSDDGLNWEKVCSFSELNSNCNIAQLGLFFRLFVVNDTLFISSNSNILNFTQDGGATWRSGREEGTYNFTTMFYRNGLYYGVNGWAILSSSNGIDWSIVHDGKLFSNAVINNKDGAVIYGYTYSKEGWTDYTPVTYIIGNIDNQVVTKDYILDNIATNGHTYLATARRYCGKNPYVDTDSVLDYCVLVSENGLQWNEIEMGNVNLFRNIIYDGNQFLSVGYDHSQNNDAHLYSIKNNNGNWEINILNTLPCNGNLLLYDGCMYLYDQ